MVTSGSGSREGQEPVAGSNFALVRRGYDPADVDRYVADSQIELHRLAAETRELNAVIAQLRRESATAAQQPINDPLDSWGLTVKQLADGARSDIARIRDAAQRDADELVEAARLTADGIITAATEEAAELVRTATAHSDDTRVEATRIHELAAEALASAESRLRGVLESLDDLSEPGIAAEH
jgi:cell division septum initiation protein DivIVA